MFRNILISLFCAISVYAKGGNLEKVTNTVYFDVTIDGEPAGRILIGLFGETVRFMIVMFRHMCVKVLFT
jgi:hypothetical protein